MSQTIKKFITLRDKLLHTMLKTIPLDGLLLGLVLLLVGIALMKPLLTMTGAVTIIGMIMIAIKTVQ